MKVQLPSRLALALGTLVTGAMAITGEVSLSHPLHQAVVLVGAVLLFLIHPQEAGVLPAAAPAPPYDVGAPTPAAPAPPAPSAQSLP